MKNLSLIFWLLILSSPQYLEAGLFGPENYDECILDKMKGQPIAMRATARRYCKNKFHVEELLYKYSPPLSSSATCEDNMTTNVNLNLSGLCVLARHEETFGTQFFESIDYSWSNKGREITLVINDNPSIYAITKIKAAFSNKLCKDTKNQNEFINAVMFDFTGRNFLGFAKHFDSSTAQRKGDEEYLCMRIKEIYGRHDDE